MIRWAWRVAGAIGGVAVMLLAAEWSLRYESVCRRLVPLTRVLP